MQFPSAGHCAPHSFSRGESDNEEGCIANVGIVQGALVMNSYLHKTGFSEILRWFPEDEHDALQLSIT